MAGRTLEADVCVVGAGFAGLTAAWRLHQASKSVIVLEARDRIGGRIWTERLSGGAVVDRGGAWLAPKHDAAFALAREMGVTTYKTWVRGSHLLVDNGRVRRYTGLIPKISPLAVLTIALAQLRIDRLAKKVPLEAPWTATRAVEWDGRTVASWLEHSGIRSGIGRDLFDMAVRGLFAADLRAVSLLDLLFLVHAHDNTTALFSIDGGAQENLVEGGMGAIAHGLADALGDAVHLRTPARAVAQEPDRVRVRSHELEVVARWAVLAVPPALALDIEFDPGLPEDRRTLYRRAVAGSETKTLLVYGEPFWRAGGFSGQSAEPGSAAEVTLDATPASGSPGVLACFTFGAVAERFDATTAAERRRAVLEAMVRRFGPQTGTPVEFVETSWWSEPWTRGCSMAHFPPGILSRYGALLRTPFGRVHWAGTETATRSHGAVDGAVRSGERAAAEVLAWNE
jgi:monoamine oxidase